MTEKLLKDPRWRLKNWCCALIALLPVMGWLGFIWMGRKSGRKQYTRPGVVYGVLSMVLLLATCLGEGYLLPYEIRSELEFYGCFLLALIWAVCLVHTLVRSGQYLKYLALHQSKQPEPHPLTRDRKWGLRNLVWLGWNITPVTCGFSILYAGCGMNNKKMKLMGILNEVIGCVGTGAIYVAEKLYNELAHSRGTIQAVCWALILTGWVYCLFCSLLVREDYLHTVAVDWDAQTRRQPNLMNIKWRLRNSAWQIWTFFPVIGPLGISFAGVVGGRKKYSVSGVVLCMLSSVLLIGSYGWWDFARDLGMDSKYVIMGQNFLERSIAGLHLTVFFLGTAIRWEVLKARAEKLQGYASEFDRELDIQNRISKRRKAVDIPEQTRQTAATDQSGERTGIPATPKRPESESVTRQVDIVETAVAEETIDGKININTCTQQELMQLPGVGVVQAKQALEHRAAGGFKSVDEFVELLKIKPHFAVRIFEMAVAETPAAAPADTVSDGGTGGRVFDF